MTQEPRRPSKVALPGAVLGLVLVGIVIAALDWQEVRRLAGQVEWRLTLPALGAACVSYGGLSLSLVRIGRMLGLRKSPTGTFLLTAYVSIALNHLISIGGIAGYSLRSILLRGHGESVGSVIAMSLLDSYLTLTVMVGMLPLGLVCLLVIHPLSPATSGAVLLAAGLAVGLAVLLTLALASARVRSRVARLVESAVRTFAGRRGDSIINSVDELASTLTLAIAFVRRRPTSILVPITLVTLDWLATIVAFWFCLAAVGEVATPAVVFAAVAIGVNAGAASLLPGGAGVQDGSTVGMFVVLGVPLESAVLATVLFRVVYYLIPFGLSLPLYYQLLRQAHQPPVA